MQILILSSTNAVLLHADSTQLAKVIDTTIYSNPQLAKEYIEILEKTNVQLGLWWNPYGIMVASLGVLFTILTIVAAIIIWTQSSNYKSMIRNTLKKYEAIFDALVKEKKKQLENIELQVDNEIEKFKKDLAVAVGDQKAEIEEKIKYLENQKKIIEEEKKNPIVMPFTVSSGSFSGTSPSRVYHQCSHCGYGYLIDDPQDPLYGLSGYTGSSYGPSSAYSGMGMDAGGYAGPTGPTGPFIPGSSTKVTQCPKCGNVEKI